MIPEVLRIACSLNKYNSIYKNTFFFSYISLHTVHPYFMFSILILLFIFLNNIYLKLF